MIYPPPRPSNPHHLNHIQQAPMNRMIGPNTPAAKPNNILSFIQQFSPPNSSSITSLATKGASGLSNTLNNVQQVLRLVETAAPLIQQYGPVGKNLPAMYKMVKAMKDISNEEDDDHESTEEEVEEINEHQINEEESLENEKVENNQYNAGQSIPKLYI